MIRPAGFSFSIIVATFIAASGVLGFASDSDAAAESASNEKATRQLFQAVYANDLTSVQSSVSAGADVEARDRWGMTPAEIAIDRGNYRVAHFLVDIRNTRRAQEAATAAAPATPAAAKAESPAPAGKRTAMVTSAAKRPVAAVPATPAAAAFPATVPPVGPNPFDPATPAPGSRLLGASAGADAGQQDVVPQ